MFCRPLAIYSNKGLPTYAQLNFHLMLRRPQSLNPFLLAPMKPMVRTFGLPVLLIRDIFNKILMYEMKYYLKAVAQLAEGLQYIRKSTEFRETKV